MPYALIKDGQIQNTIIADASFLPHIQNNWDAIVDISGKPGSPGVGWKYDGKSFSEPDPVIVIPEESKDEKQDKILDQLAAEVAALESVSSK